jgi:hypothetical protein
MTRLSPPVAIATLVAGACVLAGAAAPAQAATPLESLALTVLPSRTVVTSGGKLRTALQVRSTGTQAALAVTTCLAPPPQLAVERASGGERKGRRVCFSLGDLQPGSVTSRVVVLRAAADSTVNVQMTAGARSACQCPGQPRATSPVIRILRAAGNPKVAG